MRRETPRSDLRAERFEDLGGVAIGLDVVPGPLDPALLVDQEVERSTPMLVWPNLVFSPQAP